MAKYQPSRSFLIAMGGMLPVGIALIFGLLPELEAISRPPVPGVITFPATRPMDLPAAARNAPAPYTGGGTLDWLKGRFQDVMAWEHNPWKRPKPGEYGEHYFRLLASADPANQAKAAFLRAKAQLLYQRLLKRYPELAVGYRSIPPERNGFLKLLEHLERLNPASGHVSGGTPAIQFPESIRNYLSGTGPFDAAEARSWLSGKKALLDETRAIGLLTEQSAAGIDVDRYAFFSAREVKALSDMLMLEARLAAEEGDAARALDATRAAKGLGDHIGRIETPTLLGVTVQVLINLQVQSETLGRIIPALPAGQFDPAAWEAAVRPEAVPPAEYSRIMKGEWNVCLQQYVLPVACDVEDPRYPSDPEALVDYYSSYFAGVVLSHDLPATGDWSKVTHPPAPGTARLSERSGEMMKNFFVGASAWSKGLLHAQHSAGMSAAAFAIMKGQPVPADPVHGLPYVWDPATRTLSPPASPAFADLELKPVTVPRR